MTATRSWGGASGILKHQANVARRHHYTVDVVRLPLPRYSLSEAEPIGSQMFLPRDFPSAEAALLYARPLVQQGYGLQIIGPDGVWDHAEILRHLNQR
jgi:hypothetical protein